MNISIVYDSSTGITAKAAEAMGKKLTQHGHQCQVQSVGDVNPGVIARADLLLVGGWVNGLFIIRQHPSAGAMNFIERLDNLAGKNTVVFCTYKLAAGSTLKQMKQALEHKGANIIGEFKFRGSEPNSSFASFASSLS
ncbi:MAG: flavodoxin family protein [Ardenticatenaceae bacterium]|nr:flavodoxin family protein [Ardenticatenaceae bacterium]